MHGPEYSPFAPADEIACRRMALAAGPCHDAAHSYAVLSLHVGKRVVVRQSGTWEAAAGDVQVIPAGGRHGVVASDDGEVLAVAFCPACLRRDGLGDLLAPVEAVRGGRAPLVRLPPDAAARLHAVLEHLERECRVDAPHAPIVRRSLLAVALAEVGRATEAGPGRVGGASLVASVVAHVEAHALGAITPADVAQAFGRSPAHLTTVVREATGRTVGQWILEVRMAEARRRLAETDELVDVVGERVGYPDPSHFSRVFRRHHGQSPRAWRAARG